MSRARLSLKQVIEMDAENLSATAMLSVVEGYHGDFVSADRLVSEALRMDSREEYRDIDEFFLAYLMMYHRPSQAVTKLRGLAQRKASPIIHAGLAIALAEVASYKIDPIHAKDAREEIVEAKYYISVAKESAPNNFFVKLIDLYVRCVDMGLAKAVGESNWNQNKLEIDQLAEAIEKHYSNPVGLDIAAWYYRIVEDEEKHARVARMASGSGGFRMTLDLRAFARGEYQSRRVVFADPTRNTMESIIYAILALDDPNQREYVGQHWKQELFAKLRSTRFVAQVLYIPLLLGDQAECQQLAQQVLDDGLPEYFRNGIQTEFIEVMLRHLTGEYSNDELMAMADNTNKVSTAYLQLGLRALAEGHRTLALEHFDKSASEIAPWVAEAFLAEALRDRMVRDGEWPYWIGNEGIETSTSR